MLTEQERREHHKVSKKKYDAKTVQYVFRFRKGADADIIERLGTVPAKTDYLRELVRRDIRENTNWEPEKSSYATD